MEATTTDLLGKKCKPCEARTPPLPQLSVGQPLACLRSWKLEAGRIARTFSFENYYQTMAFVNAVACVSHRQDHHPDMEVSYNKCTVRYSTHSVGGLSENDFICA